MKQFFNRNNKVNKNLDVEGYMCPSTCAIGCSGYCAKSCSDTCSGSCGRRCASGCDHQCEGVVYKWFDQH